MKSRVEERDINLELFEKMGKSNLGDDYNSWHILTLRMKLGIIREGRRRIF